MTGRFPALRPVVLVVDDHTDTREILVEVLRYHGARAVGVANANEALLFLDGVRPDIVLTDFAMPDDDGLTLLRRMRNDPRFQDIPGVLASGHGDALKLAEAAAETGAAFVPKPFDMDNVIELIRALTSKVGSGSPETD